MSEDADVDYMMVLQREVRELRAEIERLQTALAETFSYVEDSRARAYLLKLYPELSK